MAPLGPFAAGRPVIAAVSGGADSMALAFLASRWGQVTAVIVDHGLRAAAAAESALTAERLSRLGIAATILHAGLSAGPAAAERARDARYRLLLQACRDTGCPDLLVAHHSFDQAETVRMRADAGSLSAGLAGMASIAYRGEARLLRPLLSVPPSRLRATLRTAGIEWIEDPTNQDQRTLRARLRVEMDSAALERALAIARANGLERAENEARFATELASVQFHPAGFASIVRTMSEAALVRRDLDHFRAPLPAAPERSVGRSGDPLRPWRPAPPRRPGRPEPSSPANPPLSRRPSRPCPARFGTAGSASPLHPRARCIGALGDDAARIGRRSALPSMVRRALPAFRRGGEIVAVPHLGFPDASSCRSVSLWLNPPRPAAGAAFINPYAVEGM